MNRILLLFTAVFLLSIGSYGQSQIFIASGTFIAPAGVTTVKVECWGAGGGGGGATSGWAISAAGGGSGGAYTRNNAISVVSGNNYTVNVGIGGAGGTTSPTVNGFSGGSSWFNTTATLLAVGGNGGQSISGSGSGTGAAAVSSGNSGGTTNWYGGAGANGNAGSLYSGGGGGGANSTSTGNSANQDNGGAPNIDGGTGGDGLNGATGVGGSGSIPGGGGGGAGSFLSTFAGGKGGDGQVRVSWTCPTYSLTSISVSPTTLCIGSTTVVTLNGSAVGLPKGIYTVTYDAGLITGLTATMTVSTAGSGNFTSAALNTAGSITIKITKLESGPVGGSCPSSISSGNTAVVTVNRAPAGLSYTVASPSYCVGTAITANNASLTTAGSPAATYAVSPA
ncbi:hypothetical protein DOS84_02630, partial [Flavobacterium aquariorum]